jgi:hypothetical protein
MEKGSCERVQILLMICPWTHTKHWEICNILWIHSNTVVNSRNTFYIYFWIYRIKMWTWALEFRRRSDVAYELYFFYEFNWNQPFRWGFFFHLDFKLSLWNENWVLVLWFLHGVRGEFSDDVSGAVVDPIFTGHESQRICATEWDVYLRCDSWPVKMEPTAAPETSSGILPRTPCKSPKTKTQFLFLIKHAPCCVDPWEVYSNAGLENCVSGGFKTVVERNWGKTLRYKWDLYRCPKNRALN